MKLIYLVLLTHCMCLSAFAADTTERWHMMHKGNVHVNFSTLPLNSITSFTEHTRFEDGGFGGVSLGGDYCYAERRFISVQFGVANAAPLGEVITYGEDGWYLDYTASSWFINVRHNYSWRVFDFGFGPSLTNLRCRSKHYNVYTGEDYSGSYQQLALGGCFAAYVTAVRVVFAGILYQPQFLSLSGPPLFNYQHTLSVDIMVRINFRKKR